MVNVLDKQGFKAMDGSPLKAVTGASAKRQVVLDFLEACKTLPPGSSAVLMYSGHGAQVPDTNGDETDDHRDEVWTLRDDTLIDDEIYEGLSKIPARVRVTVIADSCHAGTSSKFIAMEDDDADDVVDWLLGESKDMPRPVERAISERYAKRFAERQAASPAGNNATLNATVVLLAAAQDDELARAGVPSTPGQENSVFTRYLLKQWKLSLGKPSLKKFFDATVDLMPAYPPGVGQHPNYLPLDPRDPTFEGAPAFSH
jgi:hypothetical protein